MGCRQQTADGYLCVFVKPVEKAFNSIASRWIQNEAHLEALTRW
jgi:hypothetical protein